ncbi:MAG: molecular chaperone, partial [Dehalococcoidia bacterium]
FVVNRAGIPCPIYESAYLGEDPSAKGWLLAQLEGEYAQVGLSPSPALREPPDHAAVELEFMAFLCSCEAEAWEEKDLPKALRECQRQRTFLERHLAWWFPQFACKVAATNRDSVFATAARATTAFLAHDSDLVDALLQQLEGVREAS